MDVRIIEVGPRDGLQNEPVPVPTETKLEFIKGLVRAGLREIEATSFVSPKWVPQLGDAAELWPRLPKDSLFSALVPNVKGLERALTVDVRRIAVFTAASETFTQKNIGMSIEESLAVFADVVAQFREAVPDGFVRGYVSTAFACPYEGSISPEAVLRVVRALLALGVDEISVGDTIGVAVPLQVKALTRCLLPDIGARRFVYHFHDTRGTAIANVMAALDEGITSFDASAAGLGGCPYAPGAGGNLATEDLVYVLNQSGLKSGVDLDLLVQASTPVLECLGNGSASKVRQSVCASRPRQ